MSYKIFPLLFIIFFLLTSCTSSIYSTKSYLGGTCNISGYYKGEEFTASSKETSDVILIMKKDNETKHSLPRQFTFIVGVKNKSDETIVISPYNIAVSVDGVSIDLYSGEELIEAKKNACGIKKGAAIISEYFQNKSAAYQGYTNYNSSGTVYGYNGSTYQVNTYGMYYDSAKVAALQQQNRINTQQQIAQYEAEELAFVNHIKDTYLLMQSVPPGQEYYGEVKTHKIPRKAFKGTEPYLVIVTVKLPNANHVFFYTIKRIITNN